VTSLALDGDYVVIGLANSNIKVYSARTGVLVRTLMGHESGVWGVCLVSRGGWMDVEEERRKGKGKRRRKEMSVEEGGRNAELSETIGAEMRHALGLDEDNVEALDEEPEVDQSNSDGESDTESDEGHSTASETLPERNYKPGRPSYMSLSSIGWGQPNSIIVSGGCDKVLKVWDAKSGLVLPFFQFLRFVF
jgi:F-box and WD-40 domain protein CDC4